MTGVGIAHRLVESSDETVGAHLTELTMRKIISIHFVAAMLLGGCSSASRNQSTQAAAPAGAATTVAVTTVAATQRFRPMLVTTRGTHMSADGRWRIGVSEDAVELSRWNAYSDGQGGGVRGWSSISPNGFKPLPDWFVFVESESRVWAYDGGVQLLVYTETWNGRESTATIAPGDSGPMPAEVRERIPEAKLKTMRPQE
jgi:hypothetical protein